MTKTQLSFSHTKVKKIEPVRVDYDGTLMK